LTLDGLNKKEPQFIVDWATSPVIVTGKATNHLKVVVVGTRIEYFVNNQSFGEAVDSKLTTGDIGFFAGSFDEGGVHVSFDNVKITRP